MVTMHWSDRLAIFLAGFVFGFLGTAWLGTGFVESADCDDGVCFDRLPLVLIAAVVGGLIVGALFGFAAKRFVNRSKT
jgi:hypothetical protein